MMKSILALLLYLPAMVFAQSALDNWYGQWTVSFGGGDFGACSITISSSTTTQAAVAGSCSSFLFQLTGSVSGQVLLDGSLSFKVGTDPNGAQFSGVLQGTSGSGTWTKPSVVLSGTFTACKSTACAPVCALTASPASIAAGGTSTLTASCSPAATSYVWTGGACAGATAATCTVTPTVTTTYAVAGINSAGTGATASATVTVTSTSKPVCTLTASPTSIAVGGTSTLSASCTPAATSYTWSANTGLGSTVATGTVTPTVTTTYTVAGINSSGAGNTASATVTITSSTLLLGVGIAGAGYGGVDSSPAGISCYKPVPGTAYLVAPDCAESYASGTKVVLTATPASGSTFAGWSGACTGTGSCSVTMNAAKTVTATFNIIPFVATASVNLTTNSANITTRITFNPTDAGKSGAVFVTAWVPVAGLGALGISTALNSQLSVTSTRDNPNLAGAPNGLSLNQGPLVELDASSFVLVQLTSTGWQLVTNGQLIPYASGVLGDQLAAQTILNNASKTDLAGAQFCLGYGTNADDMIAAGRIQVVATIPDGSNGTGTGSCIVQKGGVLTVFGTRGTVTPTTPMYGSFVVANTSVVYIAVLGPSLGILGYTSSPLNLPNVRVYDASGKDVLQNESGGVTVSGCPGSATVANYYATIRGSALNVNDTCVSKTLDAGVYTFTINPNTASSSGELLFEVTVNP